MRHILRRREWVADEWRYFGEALAHGDAVVVPLAELRSEPQRWAAWPGPLGVRLSAVDRLEDLAADVARLALIAVEFPSPGEGRGYSQGRLLRTRLGFTGELRAVGAGVRQDLLFLLARCGFDALDLAPGEDVAAAQRAFARYDVAYQPGSPALSVRRQRYFAS